MKTWVTLLGVALLAVAFFPPAIRSDDDADDTTIEVADDPVVGDDLGSHKASGTVVPEGLDADNGEKFEFQAEVNRMMKLIINSLYKNKDIFLRELISNASDALDKIRFLSVTDSDALGDTTDLHIKIHVDKENNVLHITDTGIGMTKEDLVKNLGTIAKSGTSDFLSAMSDNAADAGSLIGQFGVGFYSAFLVADTVVVTTKHNDDKQHVWTSDASSFTIVEDDREDEQLGRGTRISLYLKEEAKEFLGEAKIRELVKKYSEFIAFDIYLYTSKVVDLDPEELEAEVAALDDEEEDEDFEDDEDGVEEEEEEEEEEDNTPVKTTKTVWDWEVINANKPIWTRNPKEVEEEEYNKFYQAFTKEDDSEPLSHIHFTAEGEVTFRSILFIPPAAPTGFYNDYGSQRSNIKMYVRRVFITDDFEEMMPKYLGFLKGVVDSDDLPLNVSRETLQQHKLLKVIKKKLVRKALDMIKKLDKDDFAKFWKEYGTSIKLGLIEDYSNRTRLAKLLRFFSSNSDDITSLEEYVERMKKNQETIYFIAGSSVEEVQSSPFVERLLKRGYEVLYLVEPVDEYTIQNLPEFDGKKFQNVAKEGLTLDDSEEAKEYKEAQEKEFEPLTKYLGDALSDSIEKAVVSDRLTESPCALVASQYGWSGNMERIMKAQAYAKSDDASSNFYATQKKTLEINPRHPLIKNLLDRAAKVAEAEEDEDEDYSDTTLEDTARVLLDTARLRSGYTLDNSVDFASRIERMLRVSAGVDVDAEVEPEPVFAEDDDDEEDEELDADDEDEDDEEDEDLEGETEGHDEL
jgi:heat shock protein beta